MRWYAIKHFALRMVAAAVLFAGALPLQAQTDAPTDTISADSTDIVQSPTRYERRIDRYVLRWSKLIPNHSTLQYAGSIGLISGGIGWSYGKNAHWETDLLVDFLPKYHSRSAHATFTVKERYIPWRCHMCTRSGPSSRSPPALSSTPFRARTFGDTSHRVIRRSITECLPNCVPTYSSGSDCVTTFRTASASCTKPFRSITKSLPATSTLSQKSPTKATPGAKPSPSPSASNGICRIFLEIRC